MVKLQRTMGFGVVSSSWGIYKQPPTGNAQETWWKNWWTYCKSQRTRISVARWGLLTKKKKKKTRSSGVTWSELMEKSEVNIKYYQNITLKVPLKLTKFSYFKSISQSEKAHWDRKYHNLITVWSSMEYYELKALNMHTTSSSYEILSLGRTQHMLTSYIFPTS